MAAVAGKDDNVGEVVDHVLPGLGSGSYVER